MSAPLRVLSMLSLARRAGGLLIGQDKIFDAVRRGEKLVVCVTVDCAANVSRTLKAAEERGDIQIYTLKDTDRTLLGGHLGIASAQAAAVAAGSGFAEKIVSLFKDRSDADE